MNRSSCLNHLGERAAGRRKSKLARAFAVGLLGLSFATAVVPSRAMAQADCGVPTADADHWPVATLDSVGLASATLCPLVPRLDGWKEANLHSVVVVRHGSLVFEH